MASKAKNIANFAQCGGGSEESSVAFSESAIEQGRAVLKGASDALQIVAQNLDHRFSKAVDLIVSMEQRGRVITLGMGKTSFVAMKLSATLASIGVASFFLHPAEALHGDLGRFTAHDVVMLFSNSGETAELVRLIPHLGRIGCTRISITAESHTTLARGVQVSLTIGRHEEAGPMGLAPTTSTTTMLALGDAICMAVLERMNMGREEFAKRHPGGMLGRSLACVSDVMRTGEALCLLNIHTPLREAIRKISSTAGKPGAAAVVDDEGFLVGMFTDGDLRRLLEDPSQSLDHPMIAVMSKKPRTILPSALVAVARDLLSEFHIDQIVVVDEDERPIGMIDIQDVLNLN